MSLFNRQPISVRRGRSGSKLSLALVGSLQSDNGYLPEQGGTSLITKARQLARQQQTQQELNKKTAATTPASKKKFQIPFTAKPKVDPSLAAFLNQQESTTVSLLTRLVETADLLESADNDILKAASQGRDVTPAGEWLLDNFYVIRQHIADIRQSMPKDYYSQLPILTTGPYAGYPRIYELALQVIASTEGVVTLEHVSLFIKEYQRTIQLKMGELWAFSIMLRLGLIGNIWRMTKHTLSRLESIEDADQWASLLSEKDSNTTNTLVLQFITDPPPLTPAFISRFISKTRATARTATSPLVWLEKFILERGVDVEEASRQEHVRIALTNVVMSNSITSLRNLSRFDWLKFLETHSETDRILTQDPAAIYLTMTQASRDAYRHAVEGIAYRTEIPEDKVATAAVNLARRNTADEKKGHIGYYLVDEGLEELEPALGFVPEWQDQARKYLKDRPWLTYFGAIGIISLIFLTICSKFFYPDEADFGMLLIYWAFILWLGTDVAVGIVHQAITRLVPPLLLPALDFCGSKVPDQYRTVVVLPTMFPSVKSVWHTVDQIEVLYLANKDVNVYYAILSDFVDAKSETMPDDQEIMKNVALAMDDLRQKHPEGHFYLMHRPRLLNKSQDGGTWMGWERKRGKLVQFNKFLLEGSAETEEAYSTMIGDDWQLLRDCKYVITLDADTVLPRDAAKKLIGIIAHPLNRAEIDPEARRVVKGYGIIQPRVSTRLRSQASQFAAMYSGRPGVDPYTTAVSDVYQDLFSEGSFTGKGIYDVKAFAETTEDRFAENKILSHDLIEGSFARAGLATDIEVFDDYPSNYLSFTKRKHRWIRGDWQLLRWGIGFLFSSKDKQDQLRVSPLSRWKIVDNMRRTVVEVLQFVFVLAVALYFPQTFILKGLILALQFIVFPWELWLFLTVVTVPRDGKTSYRAYFHEVTIDALKGMYQIMVTLAFLPHQSLMVVDAIFRTLYRLAKKENLLEWTTQSQVETMTSSNTLWGTAMSMWSALTLTSVVSAMAFARADSILFIICLLPFILGWLAAPYLAYKLSYNYQEAPRKVLTPSEREIALRYALLHWRYFNRFATKETKFLAPDNFQEDPEPVVAMRTSPTNIALQLLSVVSAHDLGFVTTTVLIDTLSETLATIDKLPKFKGHYFNWYGLRGDIHVLEPPYISTVDSGNMGACLVALKVALLGLLNQPVDQIERSSIHAINAALQIILVLLGAELGADESIKYATRNPSVSKRVQKVLEVMKGLIGSDSDSSSTSTSTLTPTITKNAANLSHMKESDIASLRDSKSLLAQASQDLRKTRETLTHDRASLNVLSEVEHWLQWSIGRIEQVLTAAQQQTEGNPPTLQELAVTSARAARMLSRVNEMAEQCQKIVDDMDFAFLFNGERKLFSIGYDTKSKRLDASLYDLLASESRLASYLSIAKGDAPVEHWFRLGRSLVTSHFGLVSWSGTMFEYLMPLILLEAYPHTLLDRAHHVAVTQQIAYSQTLHHSWTTKLPWGMSESAYNFRDREQTYQYRAFGVPTLALKRGQEKDYVVAPYASILALAVEPQLAMQNLALLESLGALGPYGFNDAIDYTRPAPYAKLAVVRNYMAHHIGMGLTTLCNVLNDNIWQRRFHSDPLIASAELLLHERVPREVSLHKRGAETGELGSQVKVSSEYEDIDLPAVREFHTAHTATPKIALVGTLPYTVLIDNAGSGFSNWQDSVAVTRWRNDRTEDSYGQWIYIKDHYSSADKNSDSSSKPLNMERYWSATHQPVCAEADWYKATFAVDRITFARRDGFIESVTELAVNTNHSAEVRVVTLRNFDTKVHDLQLTSYSEIVLQSAAADRPHPAFGNLFVETEWLPENKALLARRRPRSADAQSLYAAHIVALSPNAMMVDELRYETNRGNFIGRCRSTRNPQILDPGFKLSNTTGSVLDPVFAIQATIRVEPGEAVQVAFTTLVGKERGQVVDRADFYSEINAVQRTFDISGAQMREELHDLSITAEDAQLFQMMVGHMLYTHPSLACNEKDALQNTLGIEGLWAHGISGDWPILLALIDEEAGLKCIHQLLKGHLYWRQKGITADVVIVNTQPPTYLQDLQNDIQSIVQGYSRYVDKPGGIFLRRKDMLPPENYRLLLATARVHVHCSSKGLTMAQFEADDDSYILGKIIGTPTELTQPAARYVSIYEPLERFEAGTPSVTIDEGSSSNSSSPSTAIRSGTRSRTSSGLIRVASGLRTSSTAEPSLNKVIASILVTDAYGHQISEEVEEPEENLNLPELDNYNGIGGFTSTGDYEIRLTGKVVTPAPWVNVVANSHGSGFVASENGGGFTWSGNSFFYRLTPWTNDFVSDRPGELIYIRDADTGEFWTVTPSPIRHTEMYRIIHRPGSTTYIHTYKGISATLTLTMADDNSVKISVLELTNLADPKKINEKIKSDHLDESSSSSSNILDPKDLLNKDLLTLPGGNITDSTEANQAPGTRNLTITSYVEWVIGQLREHTQHQVITFFHSETRALCARNYFNSSFSNYVSFHWTSEETTGFTSDRREFLGRNGHVGAPLGLVSDNLIEAFGVSHDPCAVTSSNIAIAPGESKRIVFLLGSTDDTNKIKDLVHRYGNIKAATNEVDLVTQIWNDRLGKIKVKTPDPTFDIILNRWLVYQALSCRLWGRSATYQSGGAFGFRDQLQDVMSLVYSEPEMVREHILLSSSRQFKEGDVQHWWHHHTGRGIRTRITDDLVWLPFVVEHYVRITGDYSILDEEVPYLEMRMMNEHEEDIYDLPNISSEKGSVYDHCLRALHKAATFGPHELPLIGTGDWNDGMNKVGFKGKGESVWLAWFLYSALTRFSSLSEYKRDSNETKKLRQLATGYAAAADGSWDGKWWRRAYYDDGTPLGSSKCEECFIDSISQSWAIISGAINNSERIESAMQAVDQYLVDPKYKLIKLLYPAFDKTQHDPGYIKGYLPGVRENGAQYTHAALWVVLANATAGRGDRGFELFQMINPISHTTDPDELQIYRTEPYVCCADVYSAEHLGGRGGWSWYTGSASWMWRTGIEAILGVSKTGKYLTLNPCIPKEWDGFELSYISGNTEYQFVVKNPEHVCKGVVSVSIDGTDLPDLKVRMDDEPEIVDHHKPEGKGKEKSDDDSDSEHDHKQIAVPVKKTVRHIQVILGNTK